MGVCTKSVLYCGLVFVNLKLIFGTPIFGTGMFCDMFCDDADYTGGGSSSIEDLLDAIFDPCGDCPENTPVKKPSTMGPGPKPPVNIMIPPSNGMNLTMTDNGGSWMMNFVPWPAGPATSLPAATPAAPTTSAPPAASASAVTPAPAGNGTAPANGTATTAKPAG